jgi:hypothetical protein
MQSDEQFEFAVLIATVAAESAQLSRLQQRSMKEPYAT